MKLNCATKLLEDCEKGLRKLVAEAVGDGDYPSVFRITDLAKAVAALAAEGRSIEAGTPPSLVSEAVGNGAGNGAVSKSVGRTAKDSPTARQLKPEYPKFFRRGDELVKAGWSKKDGREYSHRAPREVIDVVATAVRQAGAKGRLFNGDALLPLKDRSTGEAIPDYQAYVALAWLRQLGVVEQRGRRAGYTLVPSKQIESTITAAWPELAEWRG
jgi:hypothetical protein